MPLGLHKPESHDRALSPKFIQFAIARALYRASLPPTVTIASIATGGEAKALCSDSTSTCACLNNVVQFYPFKFSICSIITLRL